MSELADAYLRDLGTLLLDRVNEARADITTKKGSSGFERGRLFGLAEAVGVMVNQAKAFEINLKRIGLDKVDVDALTRV